MSRRPYVFIMDPIESINVRTDTTFVMMLEAQRRGHPVFCAEPQNLEFCDGHAEVTGRFVTLKRDEDSFVEFDGMQRLRLNDAAAIFMRKDPPVDVAYGVATLILDRVDRRRVVIVNDPASLLTKNEKLFTLEFGSLVPPTVVASKIERLAQFVKERGDVVVKPLFACGGFGVVRLVDGDKNVGAILELLTDRGRTTVLAQAYLPDVVHGDRRVFVIEGQAAGVINRRPKADELRANMHVGGIAEAAELTPRDIEIAKIIGPTLIRHGILFAGLDVIGSFLTEINITSPTGLQEYARFSGIHLEARIIDFVERRVLELDRARG